MELRNFFLNRLHQLIGKPVEDLDSEEKLRHLRREILSKPVIRDQRERIGGYYNPSGLRKLRDPEYIKKRSERVRKWLTSH